MRKLLFAALLGLAGLAQADRYALLVAIDNYPIVQGRQLSGSDYDLKLMKAVLNCYQFQTDQLQRSEATHKAILAKLDKVQKAAKQGDDVVFYFSGRGSITPPAGKPTSKVQMEPTLVSYDGEADDTGYDVRMGVIEDWAKKITDVGATVTIIVDASFQSATRDDVGRPYNPMPRTIKRKTTLDGEVREEPYLGPGIYLAATPSGGSAYEYLINANNSTWDGAFTDLFANEVLGQIHKGMAPTYAGVMREVQAYVKDKVRQDYMPGLAPYPFAKTLVAKADVYDKPMFGGITPSTIPVKQQAVVTQLTVDHEKRENKLRIGLSFPAVRGRSAKSVISTRDADDMEKDRDPQLVDAITKYVAAHLPYAEVEPAGAPVDMIVALVKQSGTIEARVAGDEVDQARNLKFTGPDIASVMSSGLSDHLERQSLTVKLFKFLDSKKPTWDADANVTADKDTYKPKENFSLDFKCPQPAALYIFDRDDSDGIVQMTFPAQGAGDNHLPAGSKNLTGTIEDGSPTGKMLVRALFVESSDAVPLPPIGTDVLAGLLNQLRVLVPAIENGTLKWTTKELNLTIQP